MDQRLFYTRKLPHWQPREETFFVTYRLAGSLPNNKIQEFKKHYYEEKLKPGNQSATAKEKLRENYFFLFDSELALNLNEPQWLKKDTIARTIMDSLLFNDKKQYILWASCIMSNHVHILIKTCKSAFPLNKILQMHKGFTAVQCNKILKKRGQFWAEESFDTIIRNNRHFFNTVGYILNNPVKAGLITNWIEWKWTYLHPELEKEYKM